MAQAETRTSNALTVLADARGLPLVADLSVKFAACLTKWATRRRTRMALGALENRELGDVGLTPDAAQREAAKVFWQA